MGYEVENSPLPDDDSIIIHYNSFRAYANSSKNLNVSIQEECALRKIIDSKRKIEAVILVCSKQSLIKRASLRDYVEPDLRSQNRIYPNNQILDLLNKIDLYTHYTECLAFFNQLQIDVKLLDSNNEFTSLPSHNCKLDQVLSVKSKNYSANEIDLITEKYRFEYHSINLPFDRSTKGDNKNFRNFEKLNFRNKTVLDVGCGYGALCFFAERQGASSILGTELKPHRYIGAVVLKNILSSNALFSDCDIFEDKLKEQFDIVFLLNVIHHLSEPFYALRELAKITKEIFILEFPTLADPKFRKTIPHDSYIDERLPFIGVSSINQDQTFVFNRLAIERYMDEHITGFDLEFMASDVSPSREVMVARQKS